MKLRTAKKRISRKLNQDDFSHGFKVFFYKYATIYGYLLDICTARPKRQGASKTTMNEQIFHRSAALRAERIRGFMKHENEESFEDYDENVTLTCVNCGDTGCSGWYVLDPIEDTRLQPFIGFKGVFCSAECVCEYLDIPFYNDDELDKDSFE